MKKPTSAASVGWVERSEAQQGFSARNVGLHYVQPNLLLQEKLYYFDNK